MKFVSYHFSDRTSNLQYETKIDRALVEVNHILSADFLAKEGSHSDHGWRVWRDTPTLMGSLVLRDELGTVCQR